MASRYWVGGTDNWDNTAGAKWSATSGGAGGASVPASGDDVFFDANSGTGTVTKTTSATCLTLNFTGFTGTFTIANGITQTVTGSGATVTLGSGMTFTTGTTGELSVRNAVANPTTINFNGITIPRLRVGATNTGTHTITANGTTPTVQNLILNSVNNGNVNITNQVTYTNSINFASSTTTFGGTAWTISGTVSIDFTSGSVFISSGFTIPNGSTLVLNTSCSFTAGTYTFDSGSTLTANLNTVTISGTVTLNSSPVTFYNITTGSTTLTLQSDLNISNNLLISASSVISTITAASSTNINVSGSMTITGTGSSYSFTNTTVNLIGTGSVGVASNSSLSNCTLIINTTNPSGYTIGGSSTNSLAFTGTSSFSMVGNSSTASVFNSSTLLSVTGICTVNTNLTGSGGNQIIYANCTLANNATLVMNSPTEFSGTITCSGNATFSGTHGFVASGFTNTAAGALVLLQNINANPNAEYIVTGQLTLIGTAASRVRIEASGSASFTGAANGTTLTYSSGTIPTVGMTISQATGTAPAGLSALFPNRPVINGGSSPNFTLDLNVTPSTGSIAMRAGFKAKFTLLNNGATQNVAYTTTQDIDSSEGQTILSFASNTDSASTNVSLFRTLNWGPLVAPSQSQYAVFGD